MIRIAITAQAFDALAGALPLGNVGFEREPDEKGERLIWLEPRVVAKLRALRGPGESYSDVILRLVRGRGEGRALGAPRGSSGEKGRVGTAAGLEPATSLAIEQDLSGS
jgi:hypothetical protein